MGNGYEGCCSPANCKFLNGESNITDLSQETNKKKKEEFGSQAYQQDDYFYDSEQPSRERKLVSIFKKRTIPNKKWRKLLPLPQREEYYKIEKVIDQYEKNVQLSKSPEKGYSRLKDKNKNLLINLKLNSEGRHADYSVLQRNKTCQLTFKNAFLNNSIASNQLINVNLNNSNAQNLQNDYLQIGTKQSTKHTTKCFSQNFEVQTNMDDSIIETKLKPILEKIIPKNKRNDIIPYLLENFIEYSFEPDSIIYRKGEVGFLFYVIESGSLILEREDSSKRHQEVLKEFEYFGEEVFQDTPNKTTIRKENVINSNKPCTLLILDSNLYKEYIKKLSDINFLRKYNYISNLDYFKHLDLTSKFLLTERCPVENYSSEKTVAKIDSLASTMIILQKGNISLINKENKVVNTIKENEYFGLNSFYQEYTRPFNAITSNDSTIIKITKEILTDILRPKEKEYFLFSIFQSFIKNHNLLKGIFSGMANKLYKISNFKYYRDKEYINFMSLTSSDRKIIMILDGCVKSDIDGHKVAGIGDVLGYEYLYKKDIQLTNNYYASPEAYCIEFEVEKAFCFIDACETSTPNVNYSANNFTSLNFNKKDAINAAANLKTITPKKMLNHIRKFQNTRLINCLDKKTFEKISGFFEIKIFSQNEQIFEENSNGSYIYLIIKGKVKIIKKGKIIRYLNEGSCFGERIISLESKKRSTTVIADEPRVVCYRIHKNDFNKIISKDDPKVKEYFHKKLMLENESVSLSDLFIIQFLGNGKYGNVYMVHDYNNIYAIKTVSRLAVSKQKNLGSYYAQERRILMLLDHPFVVKLVKTMKNNLYCFFLMEHVNGIAFSDYLNFLQRKGKLMSKEDLKFYVSIIAVALGYLQKRKIAHRDLKPSNIMLEENGYLKLIDFGTAKIMKDYATTRIGTPHYMAPEILKGKGYFLNCDFWSLGICSYEMYYNRVPFGYNCRDVNQIYNEIVYNKLQFPQEEKISKSNLEVIYLNSFLSNLLQKNVNNRYSSLEDIQKDKFFVNYPWGDLENFKIKSPYKPTIKDFPKMIEIGNLSEYNDKFENRLHKDYIETTTLFEKKDGVSPIHARNQNETFNDNWADEF